MKRFFAMCLLLVALAPGPLASVMDEGPAAAVVASGPPAQTVPAQSWQRGTRGRAGALQGPVTPAAIGPAIAGAARSLFDTARAFVDRMRAYVHSVIGWLREHAALLA